MFSWLIATKLGRALMAVGSVLVALVTFGAWQRHEGASEFKEKTIENDRKKADDIRRSVRDVGRGPVPDGDIKYRD